MNAKTIVGSGLSACRELLSYSALCLGVGIERETALKVGAIFAASKIVSEVLSNVHTLLEATTTAIAYRPVSLTLGSTTEDAKLAGIVKLVSLVAVQILANPLIDGIYSEHEREEAKKRAGALISGVTFGVIAHFVGYSHKVAALTAVIFSVGNLVNSYATSRISEVKKIPFTNLSEEQSHLVKWLLSFATSSAISFATGRALKPLIA